MRQQFQFVRFGCDLRHWREFYGFTMRDVANAIGCSTAHISNVENGWGENHTLVYVLRIADIMEVDIQEYFSEGDD